jgi:hypothetical protein
MPKTNKNADAKDYQIIKTARGECGSGRVQYIRDGAKREEREDGVEKITAEAFVPFIKQRRRERLFARQTVGIHITIF